MIQKLQKVGVVEKDKIKVLFLLSRVLGGKTFSNAVVKAVDGLSHLEPTYVFFDVKDYTSEDIPKKYKSKFNLFGHKYIPSSVIKNKIKNLNVDEYDLVFIQSQALTYKIDSLICNKTSILATDTTTRFDRDLWIKYLSREKNKLKKYKSVIIVNLKYVINRLFFDYNLRHINYIMPRTKLCADYFSTYCKKKPEHMVITPGYIDVVKWKPFQRKEKVRPQLLFVGNDFERKGGKFLLELFERDISDKADLAIISNDKCFTNLKLPQNVIVYSGLSHDSIDQIIDIYNSSDIFVFPTTKEHLGLVLLEALAMELPIVATDVGAVSEIVISGVTGYLMPYHSSMEDWSSKLIELIDDQEKRVAMGRSNRVLAQNKYSEEVFKNNLHQIIDIALVGS